MKTQQTDNLGQVTHVTEVVTGSGGGGQVTRNTAPLGAVTLPVTGRGNLHEELVEHALTFVGTTEATGHNDGPQIEAWIKDGGGQAKGEQWCMAFSGSMVRDISRRHGIDPHKDAIADGLSCYWVWAGSKKAQRTEPKPGFLVIWQKGRAGYQKEDNPDHHGHVGVVIAVEKDGTLHTVEGNTSSGDAGSQRDGQGVWKRRRGKGVIPGMHVIGFLDPWPEETANQNVLTDGGAA